MSVTNTLAFMKVRKLQTKSFITLGPGWSPFTGGTRMWPSFRSRLRTARRCWSSRVLPTAL